MIKAENVVKWFGPTLAVDDVTFEVRPGEVLGFLGPNGAGKSTTMRMLTGFLPLSSGGVRIGECDIDEDPIGAKSLIGYLPENAPAYPEMSVTGFLHFAAELRGMRGAEKKEAVERVIETCFLQRVRSQCVETLSKGYRHRVCFAQALIHDPPVLVLDEPTDGLDPNQKHEVRELISSMSREKGKTIIVSTHILEEVEAICTRVIIIDRGRLVFNGTPDSLKAQSARAGSVELRAVSPGLDQIKTTLEGLAEVAAVETIDKAAKLVRVMPGGEDADLAVLVGRTAAAEGWVLAELRTAQGRLDEVFREVTIPDTEPEATRPDRDETPGEEAAA